MNSFSLSQVFFFLTKAPCLRSCSQNARPNPTAPVTMQILSLSDIFDCQVCDKNVQQFFSTDFYDVRFHFLSRTRKKFPPFSSRFSLDSGEILSCAHGRQHRRRAISFVLITQWIMWKFLLHTWKQFVTWLVKMKMSFLWEGFRVNSEEVLCVKVCLMKFFEGFFFLLNFLGVCKCLNWSCKAVFDLKLKNHVSILKFFKNFLFFLSLKEVFKSYFQILVLKSFGKVQLKSFLKFLIFVIFLHFSYYLFIKLSIFL